MLEDAMTLNFSQEENYKNSQENLANLQTIQNHSVTVRVNDGIFVIAPRVAK